MDKGQKGNPKIKKVAAEVKTSQKCNYWVIVEQTFQHSPFRSTCLTVVREANTSNAVELPAL